MTPYYQDDLVTLHHGDARALPLPDESVDLIVTSPPYFGLRDYGHDTQIGAEATPQEFIAALIECTREMMRVLKPSGSIFVNLGDKYAGAPSGPRTPRQDGYLRPYDAEQFRERRKVRHSVPQKSLMLLPERYRIAAVDELGLIARAVIVWSKPNGLPESVTDRVRRSHEDWVHLTKAPRYFAAVDEIREPHTMKPQRRPNGRPEDSTPRPVARQAWSTAARDEPSVDGNPLGKLPGSVWSIATQPLRVPAELGVDHFAAFAMEWPRRLILGWSPREVCTVCGEGRRPVVAKDRQPTQRVHNGRGFSSPDHGEGTIKGPSRNPLPHRTTAVITGYACACPDTSAPSTPSVVLDPFGGTGTTALVAAMHGRQGISIDASQDYCRLAEWRVNDPKQRERAARAAGTKPPTAKRGAKVMGTAKPQTDLFDLPA